MLGLSQQASMEVINEWQVWTHASVRLHLEVNDLNNEIHDMKLQPQHGVTAWNFMTLPFYILAYRVLHTLGFWTRKWREDLLMLRPRVRAKAVIINQSVTHLYASYAEETSMWAQFLLLLRLLGPLKVYMVKSDLHVDAQPCWSPVKPCRGYSSFANLKVLISI